MNSELQFKIARGKASYGGNAVVKTVGEVLKLHKDSTNCKGLRILHCANLVSIEGIEECQHLDNVNLSSNKIEKIQSLRFLVNLEQLDLKANRIKSLKGIEKLSKLIKIDASQNIIQDLEPFGRGNNQIQSIILYQNNLSNLEQLNTFKNFSNIKQIVFQKANKSNPFCENKQQYYFTLKESLINSLSIVQKVDDMTGQQIKLWLNEKNGLNNESRSIQQNSRYQYGSQQADMSNYLQYKKMTMPTQQLNANLASQKLMHLTQRQHDLERLIDIKDEAIDQLKQKNTHLQMTNANFYKQSLKKEVEHQRIYGQIAELSKNIDSKDAKINQLHRRIEELLKINSLKNSQLEGKSSQLQKIRRENNELRIQSSQVKILSKDQQNRLRELQNKALSNIEEKSQKIEELRRKNEDLMKENYDMQRQQDQYKDRVRELTQMLKQWEYKYQQKIKEMQQYHNTERNELIRQFQKKEQEFVKNHEDTVKHLYEQFEGKINALDRDYTQALQSSLQKFAKLKRSYDQKFNSESDLKLLMKTVMTKNTEQEQTINECQKVILESRKMITDITRQNEGLAKQLAQIRAKSQIEIKHMQGEVSRAVFDRNRLQQENKDLKMSNEYLQSNFDKLNFKEKQMQEMEEKIQNLQTALDAKNVMLDDKNETIDNLKIEIQNMQREGEQKMDKAQFQKLRNKYNKNKDVLKQMKDRMIELQNEKNDLKQQLDIQRNLEQQFIDLRDILNKQESELKEKNENEIQLIQVIEKLKGSLKNLQEEINILKIEKNKMLNSMEDKENRWNRLMKEKERQYEGKMEKMGEETNKLKEIVKHLNQISNLTKGMAF